MKLMAEVRAQLRDICVKVTCCIFCFSVGIFLFVPKLMHLVPGVRKCGVVFSLL